MIISGCSAKLLRGRAVVRGCGISASSDCTDRDLKLLSRCMANATRQEAEAKLLLRDLRAAQDAHYAQLLANRDQQLQAALSAQVGQ